MKKIKLITMALCLCSASALFAQGAANDSTTKKIALGIGPSFNAGLGGNLKADYRLSSKLSIGLKLMLTADVYSLYNYTKPQFYTVESLPGNNLAATFSSTYYILGKNSFNSKGGLYLSLGLGYYDTKESATITTVLPVTDSGYYQKTQIYGANGFSALISIGGDFKLGPGKIYAEFPMPFMLVGSSYAHFSNETGLYPSNDSNSSFTGFYAAPFINIGYQIYL